jgi:hypothetical protein
MTTATPLATETTMNHFTLVLWKPKAEDWQKAESDPY